MPAPSTHLLTYVLTHVLTYLLTYLLTYFSLATTYSVVARALHAHAQCALPAHTCSAYLCTFVPVYLCIFVSLHLSASLYWIKGGSGDDRADRGCPTPRTPDSAAAARALPNQVMHPVSK